MLVLQNNCTMNKSPFRVCLTFKVCVCFHLNSGVLFEVKCFLFKLFSRPFTDIFFFCFLSFFLSFVSLTANSSLLGGGGGKHSELSQPVRSTSLSRSRNTSRYRCYDMVVVFFSVLLGIQLTLGYEWGTDTQCSRLYYRGSRKVSIT